ncbi:GDP-fucose synthetase [Candidatus Falkowbacteria bacterium RIFOXYC2_FULL_48_21]|uniref:GDP-L-fucose synthase n=1 Tax=Candidatus Falkowbacteria bacterium RIFOXYC2_FULL_48_21 TaxID=1798005 RepID=A0A1F5T6I3_9BACT|nr:MAG: GDP-fucose synthetase [Candidatus Falkowbacteria bacterium RIFOXYC2_FULL_48_21]
MQKNSSIYVAGHKGLVGSAIVRRLLDLGYTNLILRNRRELDLLCQKAVADFFSEHRPEYVFLAAAKVGGIMSNKTHKADFIYENLQIQNNIIHNAAICGISKLLFLGSSCIYPRDCPQPMREDYLLTGSLEKTNDAYAVAKIAGIKMCQSYNEQYNTNFISVMPTNLYGINDNFDIENGHVLPSLIRKFYLAKINEQPCVELWGTGAPLREFLYVDDLADACVYLMNNYAQSSIVNIGTGEEISIKDLAMLIRDIVDYRGEIIWNSSRPDGTPRKLLDVSKLHVLGWQHRVTLRVGLKTTYTWFLQNQETLRQ